MTFRSHTVLPFILTFSSLLFASYSQITYSGESNLLISIPEVTVASDYRDQPISKAASTIDVFDSYTISNQHIYTLHDVSNASSNLLIQPSVTYKNITIRGIGGGGRNVGFNTRVGVYVDGVYIGQAMALDNPIYDIEQIEVLKGPQGYRFGNSSDAGAINVITKQPSPVPELSLTSGIGKFGYLENTLKLNGVLNDKLTGRLIIRNEDHNGFVKNTFDGDQLKKLWRFSSRAQLKLEATENLDINLAADYTHSHQDTFLYQPKTGLFNQPLKNDNFSFNQVDFNDTPFSILEGHGFNLNSIYYLENGGEFTSILAQRNWESKTVNDNDYSALDLLHIEFNDKTQQYSEEFRYTSPEDIAWPYVIGLFFSQQNSENQRIGIFGEDVNTLVTVPGIGTFPFNAGFGISANSQTPLLGKVHSNTKAVYSSVNHKLNEDFTLHMGGRYSVEQKKLNFSIDGSNSGALSIATLNNEKRTINEYFFSPMVALSYQLNQKQHVYSKFSRAYKSGGWNVEFLSTAQVNDGFEYDSEKVNAFEIGFKHQDQKTHFSLSAFVNHYRDYQVLQFANLGGSTQVTQLRNAASVRSQGVEFGIKHLFNNQFTIDANLAYLDARYLTFPNGRTKNRDANGDSLPDAPKLSGSVTLNYQINHAMFNSPIKLSLQNSFQSSSYSGISNEPETARISARNIINAYANYTSPNKKWDINLWIKNLTNKRYAVAKGKDIFRNQISIYALPRTYGIYGTYYF